MNENPLLVLQSFGQSIWIDFISRGLLNSGDLQRMIEEDGVGGVTSNPSIFEKAITGSHDYDSEINHLITSGKMSEEIFQILTVEDIQNTADLFRPVYNRLNANDGYVSLEVSPLLANDTAQTIVEARRLWKLVNRPNVMIKVPGTKAGVPAIRQLISEGINVNVTLLFGLPRYKEIADAYISGLEMLTEQGKPLERVSSVASFFLSRIDVALDPILEKISKEGSQNISPTAHSAIGEVAIASAKSAYEIYHQMFQTERFARLQIKGAQPQRLLWASTSTKNPAYSDVKYIEALIGPNTINTIPVETLESYRDHGKPAMLLDSDVEEAHQVLSSLAYLGINLDKVTQQLEDEGVEKFSKAYYQLMNALESKRAIIIQEKEKV
jgi:transaldolase